MKIGSNDIVDVKTGSTQVNKVYLGSNLVWSKVSDPILAYSPYNVWDSEHLTIIGDVTTLLDYNNVGTAYDMANPAASNQPIYNSSSANFNSLPSFTFNGSSDYVSSSVSNFRGSDTSGIVVSVYRKLSGNVIFSFSVSASYTQRGFYTTESNNGFRILAVTDGPLLRIVGSTNIDNTNPQLATYQNSGSSYKMWIGDTAQSLDFQSGGNDGSIWFSSSNDFNTIDIGALEYNNSVFFSNIEWCFSGYFPYVDDATTLEIIAILKTKYGI